MKKLIVLLLLCAMLTGCCGAANLEGKWTAAQGEAQGAVMLEIDGEQFTLTQEGRTYTGQWFREVGGIVLFEAVEHPAQSGHMWTASYDRAADTLTLGDLTLCRE